MENLSIKHWADDDRPREKLIYKGRLALSDSELIAILLRSGNTKKSAVELGKEILSFYQNDLHSLGKAKLEDLTRIKGIGEAKAVTILAALELGRRRKEKERKTEQIIREPYEAVDILRPYFQDLEHEEFYALFLNRNNAVLSCQQISKGGIASTIVDGKVIFHKALLLQASGIILSHNHPSGSLRPSEEDRRITKSLKAFGELIGIEILDHLILTDNSYFSFQNENVL